MKRTELKVGATYSDGRKGLRRIIDFGPQYKLYASQRDEDCLIYAVVRGKRPPAPCGKTADGEPMMHSTTASFATWAKAQVSGREGAG